MFGPSLLATADEPASRQEREGEREGENGRGSEEGLGGGGGRGRGREGLREGGREGGREKERGREDGENEGGRGSREKGKLRERKQPAPPFPAREDQEPADCVWRCVLPAPVVVGAPPLPPLSAKAAGPAATGRLSERVARRERRGRRGGRIRPASLTPPGSSSLRDIHRTSCAVGSVRIVYAYTYRPLTGLSRRIAARPRESSHANTSSSCSGE